MGWPYHFVDLTEAQKLQRRDNLDWYATVAQLSVVFPLLVVQCHLLLDNITRTSRNLDGPSSPQRKSGRFGEGSSVARVKEAWRKFAWQCGEPMDLAGLYLGRRGEVLLAVGWFSWLLLLCFPQTGDDYLHLTKRFGIVAASQLPLHYLLATKSRYSPLVLLTQTSHERLNIFHQLLGRIITTLLFLHAAFYLNFYIRASLLQSKIQEAYVICGIVGIISFTTIATTTLAPVRRWSYRVFYITHISLAGMVLPILYFHVSHIRIYVYEALAMYCLNFVLRMLSSEKHNGTLKLIPNTNLIEISVDRGAFRNPKVPSWKPGQHGYVSIADKRGPQMARSNPFSVVSTPTVNGDLRFVARALNGNTARFADKANLGRSSHPISVEGQYGISTHADRLLPYDRVLFIAGGVGATFILPIYQRLLSDLSPSKGSYRRQKVSFLWVARSVADVSWAIPESETEREGFVERLKVYVTGDVAHNSSLAESSFAVSENEEDDAAAYVEGQEGIELEERKELLSEHPDASHSAQSRSLRVHAGRPDLKRVVDRTFSHGHSERVAVFVCGPTGLSRSLRREVGRWTRNGREVWFWEEHFAM